MVGIVSGQTASIEQEQNGVNEPTKKESVFANKESIMCVIQRDAFTKHWIQLSRVYQNCLQAS